MSISWDDAKDVLKSVSPVAWLVTEAAGKAFNSVDKAADEGLKKLDEEVAKETLKMQFALQQARIAQELAIAKRIENAQEVEIEEFYDTSGKGQAGLSVDLKSETAGIGVGGEGHRVTKRVYHFKGGRTIDAETVVQELD